MIEYWVCLCAEEEIWIDVSVTMLSARWFPNRFVKRDPTQAHTLPTEEAGARTLPGVSTSAKTGDKVFTGYKQFMNSFTRRCCLFPLNSAKSKWKRPVSQR